MAFDFFNRNPKEEKPAPSQKMETPAQAGNGTPEKTEQQIVSVEELIRGDKKLIFDATAINSAGFIRFVDGSFKKMQEATVKCFFVPDFEAAQVNERAGHTLRFLSEKNILNTMVYEGVGNYDALLKRIVPMGQKKGRLCFVVNQAEKRRTILNAAKAAGIFVQFVSLNEAGQLTQSAYSGNRDSRRDNNRAPREGQERPRVSRTERDEFTLCTQPERMMVTRIPLRNPIKVGDTVFDSEKKPVRLVRQELVNPNSITYSTDRPGVWAKIYDINSLNTFAEEKVKRMLTRKIIHKGLCWPTDVLQTTDGLFVGALVPESKGQPLHLAVFKQANLQNYFPNWTKKDLCDLTISILEIVTYLHSKNILMGCINPAAIRVVSKDEVYFVDTDNYQVEGFPTLVYNVSFTPPEFQNRKLYLAAKENENFAVAMLVFMLMMPGKTPYSVERAKNPADAVAGKQFCFSNGAVYGMPSMWRFMWSHLYVFWGPFYHTFQKNGKYENPADRLTAARWLDTVRYYKKKLEEGEDPESLKLYPRVFHRKPGETFYTCRVCGVAHPEHYFDRRYFGDFRICNSCIDKRSNVSFTCRGCNRTFFYSNRTAMFHASMKKNDSEWKDQKYCRDCKSKTIPCKKCGKETPYYYLRNGVCPDCSQQMRNMVYRRAICKDCRQYFDITVADHENSLSRGFDDPVRCRSCRERRKNSRY